MAKDKDVNPAEAQPVKPADPAPHTNYVAPVKEYVSAEDLTTAPERMLDPKTGKPMTQADLNERNNQESRAAQPAYKIPAEKSGEPQPGGSPTVVDQAYADRVAPTEPLPSKRHDAELQAGRDALSRKVDSAKNEGKRGQEAAERNAKATSTTKK